MSATGPRLRVLRLWAKREGTCLAIVERALRLLSSEASASDDRREISLT